MSTEGWIWIEGTCGGISGGRRVPLVLRRQRFSGGSLMRPPPFEWTILPDEQGGAIVNLSVKYK